MTQEELHEQFMFHKPDGEAMRKHVSVRAACLKVAVEFYEMLPESAEKTLAIRKLREASMWANAAIALDGSTAQRPNG